MMMERAASVIFSVVSVSLTFRCFSAQFIFCEHRLKIRVSHSVQVCLLLPTFLYLSFCALCPLLCALCPMLCPV
jgi:hypothetical protein